VLSTSSCTVEAEKEKSKCAGLAQENGFGSAIIGERVAGAGYWRSNILHLQTQSVINMI
jgi:hypothetical protein